MTPRRALRTAAALSLAAAALTACTAGDDEPTATASGSPSPSSANPSVSTAPTLADRSAEVVDGAEPLADIATTKARSSSSFVGSTFTIHRLTRTERSTLLVWTVTGGTSSSNPSDANVRFWENYPVLSAQGKKYSVVTFDKQRDGWSAVSNPILRLHPGKKSPPQSALYPPLPAGTTEVTLNSPWFDDVTVPVTEAD